MHLYFYSISYVIWVSRLLALLLFYWNINADGERSQTYSWTEKLWYCFFVDVVCCTNHHHIEMEMSF